MKYGVFEGFVLTEEFSTIEIAVRYLTDVFNTDHCDEEAINNFSIRKISEEINFTAKTVVTIDED